MIIPSLLLRLFCNKNEVDFAKPFALTSLFGEG